MIGVYACEPESLIRERVVDELERQQPAQVVHYLAQIGVAARGCGRHTLGAACSVVAAEQARSADQSDRVLAEPGSELLGDEGVGPQIAEGRIEMH
jgi:hypothetical protein